MEFLQAQSWPGNVRELENVVRKALLLAQTYTINLDHVARALNKTSALGLFPGAVFGDTWMNCWRRPGAANWPTRTPECSKPPSARCSPGRSTQAQGNQAKAARWLGISRITMKAKLVQFGLHPAQGAEENHTATD